jgi:pyoverdine/dityrosine biosynthesis protein Dit1
MRIMKSKKAYKQVLEKVRDYCVCVCIHEKCQIALEFGLSYADGYGEGLFS